MKTNYVLIDYENKAFRLDQAPQDQNYVPYTSVSVIGQIKELCARAERRDQAGTVVSDFVAGDSQEFGLDGSDCRRTASRCPIDVRRLRHMY